MKRYILRSVKYFVAMCVLCLALIWLKIESEQTPVTFEQMLGIYFSAWNGWAMAATIVLLSATYPLFGFVRRSVDGDLTADRTQVLAALEMEGYALVSEQEGALHFRAGALRRLTSLFEDEIVVRQSAADQIEIEGLRRAAVRVAIRMDGYITNNRRVNG